MIDPKFTWSHHLTYISAKISKSLYILNRLKSKLNSCSLLSIYFSLVYPHLTYCNIVWGNASKSLIHDLFLLQKRAIRIICKTNYLFHTDILFRNMNLLKLSDINTYFTCLFISKYLNNQLPDVCNCFLIVNNPVNANYNLRISNQFVIPPYRTTVREKFVRFHGPRLWSLLPDSVTTLTSEITFKSYMKRWLIQQI